MPAIDTLIINRTTADRDRAIQLKTIGWPFLTAAQQAEWLAGMKGRYSEEDLNRVEAAVAYLTDRFNALPAELAGYLDAQGVAPDDIFSVPYSYPVNLTTKTDWSVGDIPAAEERARYLANVAAIRAVLTLPDGTPEPPATLDGLGVAGANNIELILAAVDAATLALEQLIKIYADRAVAAFPRAGALVAGGFTLPTARRVLLDYGALNAYVMYRVVSPGVWYIDDHQELLAVDGETLAMPFGTVADEVWYAEEET